MKEELYKITLRVTQAERDEIKRRADAEQKTVNRYLKDLALGSTQINGKLRCDMIRQLCKLSSAITPTMPTKDYSRLKRVVSGWRFETMRMLEDVSWQ